MTEDKLIDGVVRILSFLGASWLLFALLFTGFPGLFGWLILTVVSMYLGCLNIKAIKEKYLLPLFLLSIIGLVIYIFIYIDIMSFKNILGRIGFLETYMFAIQLLVIAKLSRLIFFAK